MAKKHVYQKSISGVSDFVYVDLLPEVKRARQFNMNVIIAGTLAVLLVWGLIFVPYRQRTELFEEKNGHNNDLQHRLDLKNEELLLHEIDLSIIEFEQDIDDLEQLSIDFNQYLDEVSIMVAPYGHITEIIYNAETATLRVRVIMINSHYFSILENNFLELSFVKENGVSKTDEEDYGDVYQMVQYTLEVDQDVE